MFVAILLLEGVQQSFCAAAAAVAVDITAETMNEVAEHNTASMVKNKKFLGQLLLQAVARENVLEVNQFLKAGAPVDARLGDCGMRPFYTALMAAVDDCSLDVVVALLDAGACVNARGKYDNTPLMVAVSRCYLREPEITNVYTMVRLLIDKGAAINTQNNLGRTALYISAENGWCAKIVKMLIDAGAGVDIDDYGGYRRP